MSFFSTLLRLCFVILPPSTFHHSPLWLQHKRCKLLETKTKLSGNLITDLGSRRATTMSAYALCGVNGKATFA